MRLLLRNLLDNALRLGAGGGGVQTRALDGKVWLTVRNHGPGVDPAQRGRLGEPFYRPDAVRARSAGGVGLGLYLCSLGGRLAGWPAAVAQRCAGAVGQPVPAGRARAAPAGAARADVDASVMSPYQASRSIFSASASVNTPTPTMLPGASPNTRR